LATAESSPLPLHDALPIYLGRAAARPQQPTPYSLTDPRSTTDGLAPWQPPRAHDVLRRGEDAEGAPRRVRGARLRFPGDHGPRGDRKSTRLNSSHERISYA